jgi:uncharacterized protein YktA (UPF0223 family)
MKCDLIYKDIFLSFDKNNKPLLNSNKAIQDYQVLRSIFTSPKLMSFSTFFGRGVPASEEDLNKVLANLCTKTNNPKYGMKIVYLREELVGISAIIDRGIKIFNKNAFEIVNFPTEKHIGAIYVYFFVKNQIEVLRLSDVLISSSLATNISVAKLLKKFDFKFLNQIEKKYQDKIITIDVSIYYKKEKNILIEEKSEDSIESVNFNQLSNLVSSALVTRV